MDRDLFNQVSQFWTVKIFLVSVILDNAKGNCFGYWRMYSSHFIMTVSSYFLGLGANTPAFSTFLQENIFWPAAPCGFLGSCFWSLGVCRSPPSSSRMPATTPVMQPTRRGPWTHPQRWLCGVRTTGHVELPVNHGLITTSAVLRDVNMPLDSLIES